MPCIRRAKQKLARNVGTVIWIVGSFIITCGNANTADVMSNEPVETFGSLADILTTTNPEFDQFLEKQKTKLAASPTNVNASELYKTQQKERYDFYRDYLSKYWPKAFVICEQIFTALTPDQVEAALRDLVVVFTEQTWFYFANKPHGFKITHYWELIIDQLSWISEFVSRAYIDKVTNKVYLPSDADESRMIDFMLKTNSFAPKNDDAELLFDYLTQPGKTVVDDFYAMCFDYVIKLFNEGILLQELRQATTFSAELKAVSEKLRGSKYEAEYHEHMKTAEELFAGLKEKKATNSNFASDWFRD